MTNKVVAITGASSGLGEELAYQLAKKNYQLILIARQHDRLHAVAQKCRLYQTNITIIQADLSNEADRQKVIEHIKHSDILINNAGYGIFQTTEQFNIDTIEHMMAVNTIAPIHLTKSILPTMYRRQSGHIIFIASQASKIATPKTSVYAATKFAIRGFANALRLEAKPYGVFVTTVNPGPIKTNFFQIADKSGQYMTALKHHFLSSKDVANRIVRVIEKPKREINVPFSMSIGAIFSELFPKLSDFFIMRLFNKK